MWARVPLPLKCGFVTGSPAQSRGRRRRFPTGLGQESTRCVLVCPVSLVKFEPMQRFAIITQ